MVSFDTCRVIIRKSNAAAAFQARKNILCVLRKKTTWCGKNFVSDIPLDTHKTVKKENKIFCALTNAVRQMGIYRKVVEEIECE